MAETLGGLRQTAWWRMLLHALPAYVVSRLCVLAGAAVVATELKVDSNVAIERGTQPDPHTIVDSDNALLPITNVLTSWDGLWYIDLIRFGYPRSVPPDVTYFHDEARAAFFPLFPLLGRAADRVLPAGDTFAVLILNLVLGLVAVVLIALLAQRLYSERVGRTTATLVTLFPGSFVLSFAYSEALMIVLAAAAMHMLLDRRWLAAGVFAALTTATRPNGLAIVACCAVAAIAELRTGDGDADHTGDRRAILSVLLAPLGFVAFQVWLGRHAGETGVWFRVQREAWDEGASFGWTAVKNTVEAVVTPLTSPTDTITAITVLATVILLVFAWRARLPSWMTAYSWAVLAMMLTPSTVTARPRFLFTAFPLLIGAAVWFDRRRRDDETVWPLTLAASGAGLTALTALYGVIGAIP